MPESKGLEEQISEAIRRIIRAFDLQSRRLVEEIGLTGPQLATLREAAREGRVTIGSLARAVHLSQPTVTGILDRLERRGLILRSRDGTDRRTVVVTVSPAGRDALNCTPSLLQDRFRRELARLKEWEQTMMLAVVQRIAEMMAVNDIEDAVDLGAAGIMGGSPIDADPAVSACSDFGLTNPISSPARSDA